jgi:RNA polymerase sigma-70 factor (ECF subfamily)
MSDFLSLTWQQSKADASSPQEETAVLIQRCLAGDESAYIILYTNHAAMVYRLAYGLLQHKEDAEEVLQDSFEYAFRKLAHYDARKSAFTTWLYRITVSRCRNKRRRKWLPSFSINGLVQQDIPDPNARQPDEVLQQNDQQRMVWAALSELSPKLRETAVLRYYHGLRYSEIGEILGISPKTAESRMRLAHGRLRELLDRSIDEEKGLS